jgi:hypothetical protein
MEKSNVEKRFLRAGRYFVVTGAGAGSKYAVKFTTNNDQF